MPPAVLEAVRKHVRHLLLEKAEKRMQDGESESESDNDDNDDYYCTL